MMNNWEYLTLNNLEMINASESTVLCNSHPKMSTANSSFSIIVEMRGNGWELITVRLLIQGMNEFCFRRLLQC